MPRGSRGTRKNERLQIKMGYVVDATVHRTEKAQKAARVRALWGWFDSDGHLGANAYKGVHLVASWRNPDNWNPAHANWKTTDDGGQSLKGFYETMHGRGGALYAMWQQNLKDLANVGTSENGSATRKKPKARRRIVSKVVKRRDGKKYVRARRVAKRKTAKPVRSKPQRRKGTRKTRKPRKN